MTGSSGTLGDLFECGMRPFFVAPSGAGTLPDLPRGLGDFAGVYCAFLEFRVTEPAGAVDFSWSQVRGNFAVPPAIAHEEPWSAMVRFGERWHAGAPEFAAVRSVVYEIDQDGDHFGAQPAIFFHRIKSDASTILATYRATNALLGRPPEPETEATLARALAAMPPGAVPLCFGYMLSRPNAPLRFEVLHVDANEALPGYLRSIGWPGDIARVSGLLAAMPGMVGDLQLALAFDVGDGVGPRLGLEFSFNESDRPRALARAFDELIAVGLCLPEYRETVAKWIGDTPLQRAWPGAFSHDSGFQRIISHFKVVFDGPAVEAKCYLECVPRQVSTVRAVAGQRSLSS